MDRAADIAALQQRADSAAFIRISRVKEISGLSKSTLLRWIKAGKFPAPVVQEKNKSGGIAVCLWDLGECHAWRAAQFRARDERMAQQSQQPEASA